MSQMLSIQVTKLKIKKKNKRFNTNGKQDQKKKKLMKGEENSGRNIVTKTTKMRIIM